MENCSKQFSRRKKITVSLRKPNFQEVISIHAGSRRENLIQSLFHTHAEPKKTMCEISDEVCLILLKKVIISYAEGACLDSVFSRCRVNHSNSN